MNLRKSLPDKLNRRNNSPGAKACLQYSRNSKAATDDQVEWLKESVVGGEVGEVKGAGWIAPHRLAFRVHDMRLLPQKDTNWEMTGSDLF